MFSIEAAVVGAGQAGLAVSRCLTDAGVDHVVLERGRVAERWRSQRWDSLRLLTPNWTTRLPGWSYQGSEPDGYMSAAGYADYLASYAASFDAPVLPGTAVTSVEHTGSGFTVRSEGALQLIGRDHPEVDLPTLQALGVQLTGRVVGIDGTQVCFADDLASTIGDADCRMRRVLSTIDDHIAAHGTVHHAPPPTTPSIVVTRPAIHHLDLRRAGISTVLWATGYTRAYPWLRVPEARGGDGEIRQRRGVTPVAGLYVVGQRFQHRRDSDFIDGVRHDAATVARHITHPRRDHELPAC